MSSCQPSTHRWPPKLQDVPACALSFSHYASKLCERISLEPETAACMCLKTRQFVDSHHVALATTTAGYLDELRLRC